MPPRNWQLRIEDIIECIDKISRYIQGMDMTTFLANDLVVDAVVRNISVIGEAARHVPDEIQTRYPHLPWREMRGMRNVIVHEYFGADAITIWETACRELPPLVEPLRRILHDNSPP